MLPHTAEERRNVIDRVRGDELTIVEHETNPEVVHENWKSGHNCQNAPWPTKLIPKNASRSAPSRVRCQRETHSVCESRSLSVFLPSSDGEWRAPLTGRCLRLPVSTAVDMLAVVEKSRVTTDVVRACSLLPGASRPSTQAFPPECEQPRGSQSPLQPILVMQTPSLRPCLPTTTSPILHQLASILSLRDHSSTLFV